MKNPLITLATFFSGAYASKSPEAHTNIASETYAD